LRKLEGRSAQFPRLDTDRRTSDFSAEDSHREGPNVTNTAAWSELQHRNSGRLMEASDADRDCLPVCPPFFSLGHSVDLTSQPQARPTDLFRGSVPPLPPLQIPSLQQNGTQQQQQQSRALYPQHNGPLTYPVTRPSSSSSPTYSVRRCTSLRTILLTWVISLAPSYVTDCPSLFGWSTAP
jgi:hypothetical protein